MFIWSVFKDKFEEIILNHDYYAKIFMFLQKYENNVLLYGKDGFPIDLFITEVVKAKFNLSGPLHKTECHTINKDIVYHHNPYFLEIDLKHPSMISKNTGLSKFIVNIISNKNIVSNKHFIIIKHIDMLNHENYNSFRIILEKYATNVYFLCTANNIDKIDVPVKSRFSMIRMPLFTHQEIQKIFKEHLKCPLKPVLDNEKNMRNIIKIIALQSLDNIDDVCMNTLHFPPIMAFSSDKKKTLEKIRKFTYECFQYKITISEITQDLLKILPKKYKPKLIQIAAETDHMLQQTNKGREPIYIESFLCQIFL